MNVGCRWCPNPFEWLDVTAWGHETVKLSTCIESWGGPKCRLVELTFTEAATLNVDAIWNGQRAQQIRYEANNNGVASFCRDCPRLRGGLTPTEDKDGHGPLPLANAGPKTLNLAYDRSCNLMCPSCRTHTLFHAPGSEMYSAIHAFQDAIVRPLLRHADRAFLAGLGDPFASPCYWDLLKTTTPEDAPTLKWYILTNGHGFDREHYDAIPTREQIDAVQFSIDAACPETYAQNRNASWSHLIDNLAFAGSLRRAGLLETLAVSMVVQWNNYKEAKAFVELAKQHSANEVIFNTLLPQGTFQDADYLHRAVHLPTHPEHAAAMELLENVRSDTQVKVTVEMPRC